MGLKANIEKIDNNIIKVTYNPEMTEVLEIMQDIEGVCVQGNLITFDMQGASLLTQEDIRFEKKDTYRTEVASDGEMKKKMTANGEVYYNDKVQEVFDHQSYSAKISFRYEGKQILTGLGQYEDGIYDYSNKTEYMYQSNMRNAFPILISNKNYAIYIDTESNMIFEDKDQSFSFEIATTKSVSYYFITGQSLDEIIASIRKLTGQCSLLPKWTMGYMQSKERYVSSQDLIDTMKEFRERKIPIDCLIQDWYTWEEGKWGEKICDKSRFPKLNETMDELHDNNMKLLWSIWPNMSEISENYAEFKEHGLFMGTSPVYDAFKKEGRDLYYEQCNREIFSAGLDGWWCDNAEPYSDADWSGTTRREEAERYRLVVEESQKHMPWEQVNGYGLYHSMGMSENWKKYNTEKRVVNLTRSIYIGSQQYGTILWSGDISARWDVMHAQIAEGLKVGMCGIPYWTLDIGGFFTVKDKYENRGCKSDSTEPLWFWNGDYNDGVNDLGYHELYTRWFQFGTFLPVFRSHGTDTPREPWNFISEELNCYDILLKYIRLRYQLIPYLYSMMSNVHFNDYTMMRSFLFDFPDDKKAAGISDAYMFGDAFLVKPITHAMYYEKDNKKIDDMNYKEKVYLPQGAGWYDFWNNKYYQGGAEIEREYTLEDMPLFVKAGSIIPTTKPVEHTDEVDGYDEVWVYEGGDGAFTYYNDKGDGYQYEGGEYVTYDFGYNDEAKTFTISESKGTLVENQEITIRFIEKTGVYKCYLISYVGENITVELK